MLQGENIENKSASVDFASGRAKETMFRVTFRQQINQIAIADNKASMIININTLIIGIIITVLGSGLSIESMGFLSEKQLVIPLAILLIFSWASVIIGILAAKPNIILDKNTVKIGKLFFGYISQRSKEQYLTEMMDLLKSNNEIYQNMMIEIYYQAKVLTRKYNLLRYAYTSFMIGLLGAVGSFLFLWLSH